MPKAPLPHANSTDTASTSSHTRLIEVLDALVRRVGGEPWGVRELATDLEESRSTVSRILSSLVEKGFAIEIGVGKYALGSRLRVLANALFERSELMRASRSTLNELASAAKRTAMLSVFSPQEDGYFVAGCTEGQTALTFRPDLGVVFPISYGEIGRQFSEVSLRKNSSHPPGKRPRTPSNAGTFSLLSEAEFPKALAIATDHLDGGLLIALSLHSLGNASGDEALPSDDQISAAMANLVLQANSSSPRMPQVSHDDDKSSVARFERLLQIICGSPNGVLMGEGLHSALVCNVVTAKKILQSAAEAGITHLAEDRFYPGTKLFKWAARIHSHPLSLSDLCRPIMQELVQETGETVGFLSYDESTRKAQFLDVFQGWRPIQYKLQTHADVSLYAGAAGKAVLAYLAPDIADSLELVKFTDATITSREKLNTELELVRARGWSTGEGERVPGAFGLAVPFFVDGQVHGSISATIPQYRKDDCNLPQLVEQMREGAQRIEKLLSLGTLPKTKSPSQFIEHQCGEL